MATYLSESENQRDAATMLYPIEHLPSSYSEPSLLPGNLMMYMNYTSTSGSYSDTLAGNSQQQTGCSNAAPEPDSDPSQQEILLNLDESRIGLHDFREWKSCRKEMVLMHSEGSGCNAPLQGAHTLPGQGLSLSLGTHVSPGFQMSSIQYHDPHLGLYPDLGPNQLISGEGTGRDGSLVGNDDLQSKQSRDVEYAHPGFSRSSLDSKTCVSPYGMSSAARSLPNSKYLKVAQLLLDEVVNVRAALKERNSKNELTKGMKEVGGASADGIPDSPADGGTSHGQDSNSNGQSLLSTVEKQELHNKLTKLLSMLDEVDSRYRQYYHQMQIVASSFDRVAGPGAAISYTSVALQTISRHFRCLRDAINGQIFVTRKSLGEEDTSSNSKGVGISRLRYVDQQLRQQRALQQLGVMQQHTWRPQRGLPENAVTVLRAWLFEHFLHPYPKDSDKIMLARQTGLTRSQVSNWFINARVRLWKPMVEEMYKEEIGDAEMGSTTSAEVAPKATKSDTIVPEDRGEDIQQSSISTAMKHCINGQFIDSRSDHRHNAEMAGQNNATLQNEYEVLKSREDKRPTIHHRPIFPGTISQSNESSGKFMAAATAAYHMSKLERFGTGSGVSLTLGLQHHDKGSLPMSLPDHHSFVTMRGNVVYNAATPTMGTETADYGIMDSGDRQHQFRSSHLLHDFVA